MFIFISNITFLLSYVFILHFIYFWFYIYNLKLFTIYCFTFTRFLITSFTLYGETLIFTVYYVIVRYLCYLLLLFTTKTILLQYLMKLFLYLPAITGAIFSAVILHSNFCSISRRSRPKTGHSVNMWGTVSIISGSHIRDGCSLHLKRCRYSENPTCPVSICVVRFVGSNLRIILYAAIASGKNILPFLQTCTFCPIHKVILFGAGRSALSFLSNPASAFIQTKATAFFC